MVLLQNFLDNVKNIQIRELDEKIDEAKERYIYIIINKKIMYKCIYIYINNLCYFISILFILYLYYLYYLYFIYIIFISICIFLIY